MPGPSSTRSTGIRSSAPATVDCLPARAPSPALRAPSRRPRHAPIRTVGWDSSLLKRVAAELDAPSAPDAIGRDCGSPDSTSTRPVVPVRGAGGKKVPCGTYPPGRRSGCSVHGGNVGSPRQGAVNVPAKVVGPLTDTRGAAGLPWPEDPVDVVGVRGGGISKPLSSKR